MSDLPKRLRIKASMIALGERIAWGSDTALMEEAADVIEALSASVENHQLHMLGMARDRDQLRATLAAQPQAAPDEAAGEVQQKTVGRTSLLHVELAQPLPPGTKLYTHPAPSQPSGRVPEVSGIGRDADHPRALVLYLREEPTDETIRAVQEALRNATPHPEQPQASASQSAPDAPPCWWINHGSHGQITQREDEAQTAADEGKQVVRYTAAWQRTQSAGVPEAKVTGAWEYARIGDFNAGWNACRDSVFTLMKKAAYMELDTTKRSIATQDELRALLAAAAPAQPAAQDQGEVQRLRELPPLGESLRSILGRPNFACAGIAKHLRGMGYAIPQKAEEEQAATIHWLVNLYLKHGEDWATHANAALAASTGQEV